MRARVCLCVCICFKSYVNQTTLDCCHTAPSWKVAALTLLSSLFHSRTETLHIHMYYGYKRTEDTVIRIMTVMLICSCV